MSKASAAGAAAAGAAAAGAAAEEREVRGEAVEAEHKNGGVTTTKVYQTELL